MIKPRCFDRKSARLSAIFSAFFLLAPAIVVAQQEVLTLEEAVQKALVRNERALAADAQVKAAEARLVKARSYFLPSLTTVGTYTRRPFEVSRTVGDTKITIQRFNALAGTAQVNLTLFSPSNLPALLQASSARNAQEFASAEERRQLSFEVSNAYLATLGIDQVLEAASHRFEYAQQSLNAAKARYAAGLVSVNDVTRAELESATAEMGATQVKGQVVTTYLQLGYLLDDMSVSGKKLLAPEFLLQAAEVDPAAVEKMIIEAQDRRLDVGSLRFFAKGQHALSLEPLLRYLPTLAFNGQFRYTNEAGLTGRATNWNLGVTMNWTIFDGFGREADGRQLRAQAVLADLDVKTAMRRVDLDVRDALVSLDSQRATLKLAEVAHQVAKRNAAETAELYRQGLSTALQVADANVSLFEAEVAFVQERYGLGIAYLNLEAALGLNPFGKEPTL
jgi:outer membrane protein TolC